MNNCNGTMLRHYKDDYFTIRRHLMILKDMVVYLFYLDSVTIFQKLNNRFGRRLYIIDTIPETTEPPRNDRDNRDKKK